MNTQVEIIDYTRDDVYYFEDVVEAEEKLSELITSYPTHEIGVSHFSVFGVEIPFTEENVEFIKENDEDEIESVVTYYKYEYDSTKKVNLYEVQKYMDVLYCYGQNEVDAFQEYCCILGLFSDVPEYAKYYLDYERILRDYKFDGLSVYPQSLSFTAFDGRFLKCYMFCY